MFPSLILLWFVDIIGATSPPYFPATATISLDTIEPDWVWVDAITTLQLDGSYPAPPGYQILSSSIDITGPTGVRTTASSTYDSADTIYVPIPVLSVLGLHCFTLSVTMGTMLGTSPFTVSAAKRPCFTAAPYFLSLAAPSVTNGPPSGGTNITFTFDMADRTAAAPLACAFDTHRVPVTYVFPTSSSSPIIGTCISPPATTESYLCIQLVPGNTTSTIYPPIQNSDGSNCAGGFSFAFNYYDQMPFPLMITPTSGPYTGGFPVAISGVNFPVARASTGTVMCQFGDSVSGIVNGTRYNATYIECESVPASSLTGAVVGLDGRLTVGVAVSFNSGTDFSPKKIVFKYAPVSSITSVVPSVGMFSGGTAIRMEIGYSNPFTTGLPITGPRGVCIVTTSPPSSVLIIVGENDFSLATDLLTLNLTMPSVQVGAGVGSDPVGPTTVQLWLLQEDGGICGQVGTGIDHTYRKDWTAEEVSPALITGGTMTLTVTGENFYASPDFACRATVEWPTDSLIAANAANTSTVCDVEGDFVLTNATSGECAVELSTAFYECSYGIASDAVGENPSEEMMWESMNVQVSVAPNGQDFATVPDKSVHAIRLPVLESIDPDSGFDFGGYVVEIALETGVSWYAEFCIFTGTTSFRSVTVAASPFSLKTVGCIAPRWTSERLMVQLQIRGNWLTNPVYFTVVDSPVITSIMPREGPMSGQTKLTITGSNFGSLVSSSDRKTGLQCVFGSFNAVPAYFVSDEVIECSTLEWDEAGPVPVELSLSWQTGVSNRLNTVSMLQSVFNYKPVAIRLLTITPRSGPLTGGTTVTLTTDSDVFNSGLLRCAFGRVLVEVDWRSSTEIACSSPPEAAPSTVRFGLSLDAQTMSSFYFAADVGNVTAGTTGYAFFEYYQPPTVAYVSPSFGSSVGGTSVVLQGSHFIDSPELSCRFGTQTILAERFVSSNLLVCKTPSGSLGETDVSVGNNGIDFLNNATGAVFTYVESQPLLVLHPYLGPITGGTAVRITSPSGPLPILSSGPGSEQPRCTFDSYSVEATVTNEETGELTCLTPAVPEPGYKTVSVYFNGQEAAFVSQQFLFHALSTIDSIAPALGPQGVPNLITITGANFFNSEYLTVRFGTVSVGYQDVAGLWISDTEIRASSPSVSPSPSTLRLPVMVSNNGVDFVPTTIASWDPDDDSLDVLGVIRYYTFHIPLILRAVHPPSANMHGGGFVSVHGGPFVNTGSMSCGFDWVRADPAVAIPVFVSPTHILCPVPDLWAAASSSALARTSKLQVALEGTQWSDSFLTFTFLPLSPPGFYTPHLTALEFSAQIVPCSPGYMCESTGLSAQLQCPPGTYQPASGQMQCVLCPIGHYCPAARMEQPIVCPGGWVCDEEGLVSPYKRCPAGFVCLEGTATADPVPSLQALNAPYRCLKGMYCGEGVLALVSIPGNVSTPQPCFQSSYCRPGSGSPFGSGAIPLGRFSPTPKHAGLLCPSRYSCGPTTGNIEPRPCARGTYNGLQGQHNCTLAFEGSIAPVPMMERPIESQCGFVAGRKGLSALSESDLCPPAMVCGFGVASDSEPKICFALSGTNATEIAQLCQPSLGMYYYAPNSFSGTSRLDPTKGNCCWTNELVVGLATRVENIFKASPVGEDLEARCARRFRQRLEAVHADLVINDGIGFDGKLLVETINEGSLINFFGVHIARVRDRILMEIERHFTFKSPAPCEPGVFCLSGTCEGYSTISSVGGTGLR